MALPQIIFPNLESEMVRAIKILLTKIDSPYVENVFVSAMRAPEEYKPYPVKQLTVRGDGGQIVQRALKEESFGINIWGPDFKTASQLASHVEALIPLIPTASPSIKNAQISLSAIRINEDGEEEQRYITGFALIRGSNLSLKA